MSPPGSCTAHVHADTHACMRNDTAVHSRGFSRRRSRGGRTPQGSCGEAVLMPMSLGLAARPAPACCAATCAVLCRLPAVPSVRVLLRRGEGLANAPADQAWAHVRHREAGRARRAAAAHRAAATSVSACRRLAARCRDRSAPPPDLAAFSIVCLDHRFCSRQLSPRRRTCLRLPAAPDAVR